MAAIEIRNFSKNYGEFMAVKNLDLQIPKGEIVGFVGKNGAGKSTTLRAIMNMIQVTEGSISVLGLDCKKDTKKIKEKVSYIPSEASFYPQITCWQLFDFVKGFTKSSTEEIQELAEFFELDLNKKIGELSLGNRKKVSLIQGFMKEAELLILDEPTNGLDPLMQNKFFEYVVKLKEQGKTIFLSSHNLSEVEKYCDKVAVIKEGELVDYFNMEEIKVRHSRIVTYTTTDGKSVSYESQEDANTMIASLAQLDLKQVEIKTKSVEDEFIDYYKEDK